MTINDIVAQCDGVDSGVYPQGLPPSYSWYKGNQTKMDGGNTAPAGWSACTGYFVAYPQDFTNKPFVACNVFVKDIETYLHKVKGGWVKVQDTALPIAVGRFDGPQTGNQATNLPVTKQADGSYLMQAPPLGYCNHGWPTARGAFTAGEIDGSVTYLKMRIDNANANVLGQCGFDWWASPSAPYPQNKGAGSCSWMKLTTDFKQMYCTQMTAAKLLSDPPPQPTGSIVVVQPPPVVVPPAVKPFTISVNGVELKSGDVLSIKQN
jgi:hypothetical protein